MIGKSVLIGTFVNKNEILCFLETLKNSFRIRYDKVFVFEMNENKKEYLVTFRTNNKEFFLAKINKSTVMHVKNGCLFSINALNKLIEHDNGKMDENYQIDWNKYKDKLIINSNNSLTIEDINKIDMKSLFFN